MLHETYAITRLIYFIISGKINTDKIDNQEVKDFVMTGMNPEKTKRFKSVEELEKVFSNIKSFE